MIGSNPGYLLKSSLLYENTFGLGNRVNKIFKCFAEASLKISTAKTLLAKDGDFIKFSCLLRISELYTFYKKNI